MSLAGVYEHLRSHEAEDLELLKRLVAQPSVSARNMGVNECAEILRALLVDLGCSTAEIFPTPTRPLVFGELKSKRKNARTVLFYGHYDTQPPDPEEEWLTPPFSPTVKDGRLYGLGTADNKGQFLAHILAVRSWLAVTGDVPVNVKFILDGEEESGSPSLPDFVRAHKELLAADFVFNSDGPMNAGDFPEIKLGSRGDLSFELSLTTATH
ncbi:MAG: M20/M25/M40 family metallo-hydrolase, partial [Pyramidobacter sp.]|nr:M20/M25/M40 family metallo-hydrolase [Pyramidobacter sp.]